jgi:hypothetical protein
MMALGLRKQFFFEKKNQKTSVIWGMGVVRANAHAPDS